MHILCSQWQRKLLSWVTLKYLFIYFLHHFWISLKTIGRNIFIFETFVSIIYEILTHFRNSKQLLETGIHIAIGKFIFKTNYPIFRRIRSTHFLWYSRTNLQLFSGLLFIIWRFVTDRFGLLLSNNFRLDLLTLA